MIKWCNSIIPVLLLSACVESPQKKISEIKPETESVVSSIPNSDAEAESSSEPDEEAFSKDKELTLNDWVAKLPENDPRRIRYGSQIQALWKERDKKVENTVDEAEDSLESLQQKLAAVKDNERKADLQRQIGSKHLASRNFKDASYSYLAAIESYETLGMEGKKAKSNMDLGTVYYQWRNFAKAEIYFTQAFEYFDKAHGPDHPDTIKARQNAMTSKSINAKVQRIIAGQKKEAAP